MMESETKKAYIPLPATNGPRPHRCEICQRSFREIATLRKHEQLHRADRPYICTTCNKSFLWSSNLKVHERVHTGERPYKCKICHRCFTQSNDLRRHERNVHQRGKLYSYKTPPGGGQNQTQPPLQAPPPNNGQMNLAAYQAFALQQRALLQHALTYESLMQNASQFAHHGRAPPQSLTPPKDTDMSAISTSSPISNGHGHHGNLDDNNHKDQRRSLKLEQVTPPPGDHDNFDGKNGRKSTSSIEERPLQSPGQSGYSPTSSKTQSPPALTSTTFGDMNGHRQSMERSTPKDERPVSQESHMDYSKYYNSYAESQAKINDLPHNLSSYYSAYNRIQNNTSDINAADSVMDLSMNKSLSSLESEDGDLDWKARHMSTLSSKSLDSESESDSKRIVTTTSKTPTVDSGIHHCSHCNIFFHDYTMYNLHQSLHSPVDEDPFLCPSCLKHCQDRIEFMFHIVWHVKYPHTIPKYQTFKESYLVGEQDA